MNGLWQAFTELMEAINKFSSISLQIEEFNQSLAEIDNRLEGIVEAV